MAFPFNIKLKQLLAAGIAMLSLEAYAIGLGDIALHSRIGEPLRAEVPVFSEEGQTLDNTCFSLAALRGSDLPVVTAAQTRLARVGSDYRLIIIGKQIINEPVFIIGLRVACGFDLQRDYVLMPAPPVTSTNYGRSPMNATVDTPKRAKTGSTIEAHAHEGDTLESIAETKSNGRISQQRRMLAVLKRANPDIDPEQYLPEGTVIQIPNVSRHVPAEDIVNRPPPETIASLVETPPAPPPRPKKVRPKANSLAELNPKGNDRVVLGGEPEILKPGELAIAPRSELNQIEERMLKMETTLRTLNQQVDNLNAAIEVTAETNALRQKLEAAQAQVQAQKPAIALPTPPPTPPTPPENNDLRNWLELGVSALIGGLIATGLAYLLSRPRYQAFGKPRKKASANAWQKSWQKIRGFKFKPGWRRQ